MLGPPLQERKQTQVSPRAIPQLPWASPHGPVPLLYCFCLTPRIFFKCFKSKL